MIFELLFSKEFKKNIKKLEIQERKRVISALMSCRIRPHAKVGKLVGSRYYKLRVGKYRVILDIINNKLIIHVIEVGHRKNI